VPLVSLAQRLSPRRDPADLASQLPLKAHFEFGQAIQEVLMHSDRAWP